MLPASARHSRRRGSHRPDRGLLRRARPPVDGFAGAGCARRGPDSGKGWYRCVRVSIRHLAGTYSRGPRHHRGRRLGRSPGPGVSCPRWRGPYRRQAVRRSTRTAAEGATSASGSAIPTCHGAPPGAAAPGTRYSRAVVRTATVASPSGDALSDAAISPVALGVAWAVVGTSSAWRGHHGWPPGSLAVCPTITIRHIVRWLASRDRLHRFDLRDGLAFDDPRQPTSQDRFLVASVRAVQMGSASLMRGTHTFPRGRRARADAPAQRYWIRPSLDLADRQSEVLERA